MTRFLAPLVLALAVAVAGLLVLRHGAATPAVRPDVLLVTIDTLRADHCSAYGYPRPTTPRLEQIARDGVRFETAYAPMPTTLPSHATMFTGLLPRTLDLRKNGVPLAHPAPVLAETLQEQGYRTAAFVSSFVLDRMFGLARGFATYDDRFARGACKNDDASWEGFALEGGFCRRGAATRAQAEAWLETNGYLAGAGQRGDARQAAPYFLWIHLFDPHDPYQPPPAESALLPPLGAPPTELARQIAAYDGEVRYADDQLGRLTDRLAAAGRLDDTLVIVVSDHGEGLMDHDWMHHGAMLYEEAVRIPFVVRWPARLPRGRVVAEPVQLADLVPTIHDLLGLAPPAHGVEGVSLRGALEGTSPLDPLRPIFVQRRRYDRELELGLALRGEKFGVRRGRWKYIESRVDKSYELYDLATDPGELHDVFRGRQADAKPLAAALRAWTSRPVTAPPPAAVPEDAARRLEALGYVE
ncbi:MAG: sulfatase [Thermodesulfobacteriota bacterium]